MVSSIPKNAPIAVKTRILKYPVNKIIAITAKMNVYKKSSL
jgi:hypothetical protein